MPGRYAAQVTLISATGASEDNQSNTFAAGQIGTLDLTYAQNWTTTIKAFYDLVVNNGGLKGISQNNHVIKFYDIETPQPNYPIWTRTFNLATVPAAVDMPQEVALCVSYANSLAVTIPRARRRGRLYISGWAETGNTNGRPTNLVCDGLLAAFTGYVTAFNALGTLDASIWSRTGGVTYPIDTAHVDNAWDTQRRRGNRSTYRASWAAP
jgi:hypothetical protein